LGVPNPRQVDSRDQSSNAEGQTTYQSHIEEIGNLRIENERLKTTVMILNSKMKVQEDDEVLNDKWKNQIG